MDFRDKWLLELGTRLSISNLVFDDKGVCQLSLDHGITIVIGKQCDTERLLVFGQLTLSHMSNNIVRQIIAMDNDRQGNSTMPLPIISLSDSWDGIQIHFELTQSELDETSDIIGLVLNQLEDWRIKLSALI